MSLDHDGASKGAANRSYPDLDALLAALEHERIAMTAYYFWQQRGCPNGSSDEDWERALQYIRDSR